MQSHYYTLLYTRVFSRNTPSTINPVKKSTKRKASESGDQSDVDDKLALKTVRYDETAQVPDGQSTVELLDGQEPDDFFIEPIREIPVESALELSGENTAINGIFKCTLCTTGVDTLLDLKIHLWNAHQYKPPGTIFKHKCFCDKEFPTKIALQTHLKKTHEKSEYTCQECSFITTKQAPS